MIKFLFANISPLQIVTKNTFWIVFGRVSSGILRAILVIYSARILGVKDFGSFTLAMNFVLIFSFLPEFGLSTILTRELAKKEIESNKVFSTIFLLTILFSITTFLLVLFTSPIFIHDKKALSIISILGLMMIFDVLREFVYAIFRAEEKMEKQGLLHFFTNLILFILGMCVLFIKPRLDLLAFSYLISVFCGTIIGFYINSKFLKNFRLIKEPQLYIKFFNSSWPIALANFIFFLLLYTDSIILGLFHSSYYVGLYNSTVKLTEFLVFFPQAIALSIFPIFSRNIFDKDKLRYYIELGIKLSFILVFPVVIGGVMLAEKIIDLIFGYNYLPAADAFKIIIFSILGIAPFLLLTNLLIAIDKRKELLIFDSVVLLINVVLNLILVPKFHFYATSYSTVVANYLGCIFALLVSKKYVEFEFNNHIVKPFISSLFMGFVVWFIKEFSIFLSIPLGALIYLLMLIILKEKIIIENLVKILKYDRL